MQKHMSDMLFSTKLWYLSTILQCVWLVVLYVGWLTLSGYLMAYLEFIGADKPRPTTTYQLPDWLSQPVLVIVLMVLLVFTIYVLTRAPREASKVTIRSTSSAVKHIEPTIQKVLIKSHVDKRAARRETPFIALLTLNLAIFLITIPMHFFVSEISPLVLWVVSIFLFFASCLTLGLWRAHVYHRSR